MHHASQDWWIPDTPTSLTSGQVKYIVFVCLIVDILSKLCPGLLLACIETLSVGESGLVFCGILRFAASYASAKTLVSLRAVFGVSSLNALLWDFCCFVKNVCSGFGWRDYETVWTELYGFVMSLKLELEAVHRNSIICLLCFAMIHLFSML